MNAEDKKRREASKEEKEVKRAEEQREFEKTVKVGDHVLRRDVGKDWQTGYVTQRDPLLVTATDCPTDEGWSWDEVRKYKDDVSDQAATSSDYGVPVTTDYGVP